MYTLNAINITTYGLTPSQAPASNIAVKGVWDMPKRIGDTHYSWGDEDGVEAYTDAGDLFFAGRDIIFYANIFGSNNTINTYLASLYTAINAFSTLVVFSTPYGDFTVQVKNINETRINGGSSLIFTFREPVVDLTGGALPSTSSNDYMFDGIPFSSFGLYMSKANALHNLAELKEQYFTKYGSEGYQIVKRENKILELNGFIIGSSLANFQTKIKALYLLLSSSGTRTVVLNNEVSIVSFVIDGFSIENVMLFDTMVISNFKCNFMIISNSYI